MKQEGMRHALVRPRSWWHNCTGGGTPLARGTRGRENRRIGPRGGNIFSLLFSPPSFPLSLSHFRGLAVLLHISFTCLISVFFVFHLFPSAPSFVSHLPSTVCFRPRDPLSHVHAIFSRPFRGDRYHRRYHLTLPRQRRFINFFIT